MRFILVILFLLPAAGWTLKAQDLSGQWTGASSHNTSEKKQKLVLNIAEGDSSFGGMLHLYHPTTRHLQHFLVSGWFHKKDSTLTVCLDKAVHSSPGSTENDFPGFYIFHYKRTGHKEILEGHWKGQNSNDSEQTKNLSIRLEKKAPPFIPVLLPPHNKKDSAAQKLELAMMKRQTELAATIAVMQDSVMIQLYDNGEIDGDSVSVFLNNELIASHLKLDAQPTTLILPLNKSLPVNKLTLYAENLGKLPPNTALMEVTTHGKIYNVFLSTDYSRNASVDFILNGFNP